MSESFSTLRRTVDSYPEEDKLRLLADLVKEYVRKNGPEPRVILDDANRTLGYLVPSDVPIAFPTPQESAERIAELRRRCLERGPTVTAFGALLSAIASCGKNPPVALARSTATAPSFPIVTSAR